MKYLMIDGNNMGIRCAFANRELKNSQGVPTGAHFGMFQSIIGLKIKYPDYQFLISWDSKSKRRMDESIAGIEKGIIKEAYKENRKKGEMPFELVQFYEQSPYLIRGLSKTGIPQIRVHDYETDDVIASYCKQYKVKEDTEDIVVITSDEDYFQIVDKNVNIFDGMKQKDVNLNYINKEYGIPVEAFVDCGALSGDTSDNIFGVPGVGDKTALKLIQDNGNYKNVLIKLKDRFSSLREMYPDISGDQFKELQSIKTPSDKAKYPEIYEGMPFSGIALASENGSWKPDKEFKKGLKVNLLTLMFEERVHLAYSLKKIDDDMENLPEIKNQEFDKEKLLEYMDYYDMESLKSDVDIFS